jgi:hypothetical protein
MLCFTGGLTLIHSSLPRVLPPPTRLAVAPDAPPAPLSSSSGGLAGRSDGERGDRPPCIVCRLGFVFGVGSMPRPSSDSASSGDAGRRLDLLPLRRPWRAAVGAGSGGSSPNKPARPDSRPRRCGPVLPSQARRGGGNGGNSFDLHLGAPDLEAPVAEGFFPMWRKRGKAFFYLSADHGGRGWRSRSLLLPIGAAVSLLLMSLLAGRGGEGCGMWSGDVAASENLRPFASNGGESMLMSALVNPVWCRGSPVSDIEAPPPNKLKAGWFLDLGLETPVTSSRSSPRMWMFAVPALLAGRGGEEKSGDNIPQHWWTPWAREVKGSLSPGVFTSPARGPVLPAARGWKGASHPGGMPEHLPVSTFLLRAAILCLPPPVRGRFWEFDGGMSLLGGVGEESTPAVPVRWTGAGRSIYRAFV